MARAPGAIGPAGTRPGLPPQTQTQKRASTRAHRRRWPEAWPGACLLAEAPPGNAEPGKAPAPGESAQPVEPQLQKPRLAGRSDCGHLIQKRALGSNSRREARGSSRAASRVHPRHRGRAGWGSVASPWVPAGQQELLGGCHQVHLPGPGPDGDFLCGGNKDVCYVEKTPQAEASRGQRRPGARSQGCEPCKSLHSSRDGRRRQRVTEKSAGRGGEQALGGAGLPQPGGQSSQALGRGADAGPAESLEGVS